MMRFITWLQTQDRNERAYWVGLLLLFCGLTWSAIGLTVVGAVMICESVLTSYLVIWLSVRTGASAEKSSRAKEHK